MTATTNRPIIIDGYRVTTRTVGKNYGTAAEIRTAGGTLLWVTDAMPYGCDARAIELATEWIREGN
jgi:hypothetical protein